MATRRLTITASQQQYWLDTGAQFLTVRTPAFQQDFVGPAERLGLLHVWNRGLGGAGPTNADGHERFASRLGMNGLVNEAFREVRGFLEREKRLLLNTTVTAVDYDDQEGGENGFSLKIANEKEPLRCRNQVFTMPLPQCLQLLGDHFPWSRFSSPSLRDKKNSALTYEGLLDQMRAKQYDPCICLLVLLVNSV